MDGGTAWTMASSEESDFYKIFESSGLIKTVVPGSRLGTPNLLCTPHLRLGVPRWFTDVSDFIVYTAKDVPLLLVSKDPSGIFTGVYHNAPDFQQRLQQCRKLLLP